VADLRDFSQQPSPEASRIDAEGIANIGEGKQPIILLCLADPFEGFREFAALSVRASTLVGGQGRNGVFQNRRHQAQLGLDMIGSQRRVVELRCYQHVRLEQIAEIDIGP
jgi:hypothetical protein